MTTQPEPGQPDGEKPLIIEALAALETCKEHCYSDGTVHHQSFDAEKVGLAVLNLRVFAPHPAQPDTQGPVCPKCGKPDAGMGFHTCHVPAMVGETGTPTEDEVFFANAHRRAVERAHKAEDQLDMVLDEIIRIHVIAIQSGQHEIAGLCERAKKDIPQKVPVIAQRDEAERQRDALQQQLTHAQSDLAMLTERRDEARAERDALKEQLAEARKAVELWQNAADHSILNDDPLNAEQSNAYDHGARVLSRTTHEGRGG